LSAQQGADSKDLQLQSSEIRRDRIDHHRFLNTLSHNGTKLLGFAAVKNYRQHKVSP
jgi:hypothetical protein